MKYFDPNVQDVVYEDALENRFDDLLNEMYAPIRVIGLEYQAATVLRRTDPVAYREAFMQWLDGEIGSGELEELPGS